MDKKILIFAVSAHDALDKCIELGVEFWEVTWVMNFHLLGGHDYSDWKVYYTDQFTTTPAYPDAWANLGNGGASKPSEPEAPVE